MLSSSKGSDPHNRAYRMTPHDHTSTSGPENAVKIIIVNIKNNISDISQKETTSGPVRV